MKYCVKCGTVAANDMRFCANCGTQFPEAVPQGYEGEAPQYVPVSESAQPYFEQPSYMNPQEDIARPVAKKSKAWLWSLLSVLLVVAIGASAWYFLLREKKDTKATISEAVFASVEDFEDLYDDSVNFDAFVDVLRELDTSEVRFGIEMQADADEFTNEIIDEMKIVMEINRSKQTDITSGSVVFEFAGDGNKADIELVYAMDKNMSQFTMPGMLDEVYSIKENLFEDLGSEAVEGILESETTPSMKEAREIFDRLVDSVQTESITEKTYALSGRRVVCEIHSITYDQSIADELKDYLFGQYMERFEEMELDLPKMENIQLIVRDDECIGIIFDSQDEEEIRNYQMLLGGEKNPWSDIYFYTDGEETSRICTTTNEDGFVIEFTDDGESSKLTLIDSERKIIVEADEEEPKEFFFAVEDGVISLSIELEEYLTTISVQELAEPPAMLSEEYTEIDEEELIDVLLEMGEAIKNDPEFAWLTEEDEIF